jgi:hypothetical protein
MRRMEDGGRIYGGRIYTAVFFEDIARRRKTGSNESDGQARTVRIPAF